MKEEPNQYDENGLAQGFHVFTTYPNLIEKIQYKDGVKHGIYERFYYGSIDTKYFYVNGLMYGHSMWFNAYGLLIRSCNYCKNKKYGIEETFWDDGTIMDIKFWKNGKEYFKTSKNKLLK